MDAIQALDVLADIGARWGENYEEALPRRIEVKDTDEVCALLADETNGMFEVEDVMLVRDLWRAIDTVSAIKDELARLRRLESGA